MQCNTNLGLFVYCWGYIYSEEEQFRRVLIYWYVLSGWEIKITSMDKGLGNSLFYAKW